MGKDDRTDPMGRVIREVVTVFNYEPPLKAGLQQNNNGSE